MVSENQPGKQRDVSLDIIRCFALFSVISVHFFLNTGYYTVPVNGAAMYGGMLLRTLFMTCVPLFLILTGYLMSERELHFNKKYVLSLIKLFLVYAVITVFILVFRKFYLKENIGFLDALFNFLRYDQYSWYLNMYFGLYLLMPFLNMLWHAVSCKRTAGILVIVLLILTAAPGLFNVFNLHDASWWRNPSSSLAFNQLIPSWWTGIYPLTYFFIGAYIKKYADVKFRAYKPFLLLIVCVFVFASFNFWRTRGANFIWGAWCDWGSFENVIDSVLVFLTIKSIPFSRLPKPLARVIAMFSELTFGAYIASWIGDKYTYISVLAKTPSVDERMKYFIPTVLTVSVISYAIAYIASLISKGIFFSCKKIFPFMPRYIRKGTPQEPEQIKENEFAEF